MKKLTREFKGVRVSNREVEQPILFIRRRNVGYTEQYKTLDGVCVSAVEIERIATCRWVWLFDIIEAG